MPGTSGPQDLPWIILTQMTWGWNVSFAQCEPSCFLVPEVPHGTSVLITKLITQLRSLSLPHGSSLSPAHRQCSTLVHVCQYFVATIIIADLRIVTGTLLSLSPQDLNSVYLTESHTQELEETPQILHACPHGHWNISHLNPLSPYSTSYTYLQDCHTAPS